MKTSASLPVAIVGAGPVGLAAAAHLAERGLPFKVYETGSSVGANIRDWGHVRLFTPWRYCVDQAALRLLGRYGWQHPDEDVFPTGGELANTYLGPLAQTAELRPFIETDARVVAVSRQGLDKASSQSREAHPFLLTIATPSGERRELARAVIDASGTWTSPNPLGAGGVHATGELTFADRIAYGIPHVLGRERGTYAGKTTLVVGAGHSAANVLLDLARLAEEDQRTTFVWATRGNNLARIYGGGQADQLPARGELGASLKDLVDSGKVQLITGFSATRVRAQDGGLVVEGDVASGTQYVGPVDRIIVATGQRPDLSITRELRLDLHPFLESTSALGPLIDPNVHSCGSVPPHGHRELAHPDTRFYTAGIKSYGRAPTFLMLTGYEQVRSVSAALAGDLVAADDVQLVLPETGVCTTQLPGVEPTGASCCGTPAPSIATSCCGGPAPARVDACCVADAEAKSAGSAGCGCGAAA